MLSPLYKMVWISAHAWPSTSRLPTADQKQIFAEKYPCISEWWSLNPCFSRVSCIVINTTISNSKVIRQGPHAEQAEPYLPWEMPVRRKMPRMAVMVLWVLTPTGGPFDYTEKHLAYSAVCKNTAKHPPPS